ncbi:MAG TPA: hypothetical protein DCO77_05585 [Nitrospiraceae bacterium]|nr:hypothetical protein [Nitrospiraceae bacterium]
MVKLVKLSFATHPVLLLVSAALLMLMSSCAKKGYYGMGSPAGPAEERVMGFTEDETTALPGATTSGKAAKSRTSDPKRAKRRPAASGLRAGYADDNKQFNYFLHFLERYGSGIPHYPLSIKERIILNVKDRKGKSVPNADVTIYSGSTVLTSGRTYSDGSFLFFPSEYRKNLFRYKAVVRTLQGRKKISIDRQGRRDIEIILDVPRKLPKSIPLDILFVLDTTGSMGEEIKRLKKTIEIMNLNLISLPSKPTVRFGMVLYKDRKDAYRTKVVPLTGDLDEFQKALSTVSASGGGDTPEDLQSALKEAIQNIDWNKDGVRLAFIITDAPPHLDYGQQYTYGNASIGAKKNGIKIHTVGTGGLNIAGEYILRQISQYTLGRYIFLTYGEKGESEGGRPGSVSHHTGSNFQTDKLEAIIIRFAKEELNNITGKGAAEDDEYFSAEKREDEGGMETLQKLFDLAVSQLVDYSSIMIPGKTPAAIFPIVYNNKSLALHAEYFSEQLALSLSRNKTFTMVERADLQRILEEMKLQLTGVVPEDKAVKAGKLMGAKMLVTGRLYAKKNRYELFLKLLRVESGEVLSVTKARIDRTLGLSE